MVSFKTPFFRINNLLCYCSFYVSCLFNFVLVLHIYIDNKFGLLCEILQQILRCVKMVAGLQCRCLASVLQPQATTSSPLSPPCLSEVEEVLASPPCLSPPPASPPASATASNGLQPLHLAAPRRHSASVAAQCQWGNFRP